MSLQIPTAPQKSASTPTVPQKPGTGGRILTWISGIVSFGLLGYLILVVAHQLLVASPVDPLKSGNVERKNQNVAVIDAVHNKLLSLVSFVFLPLFGGEQAPVTQPVNIPTYGHDVGHTD